MTNKQALKILEEMPEDVFQKFLKSIPYRVQLCCNLTNWKDVLPYWYIKTAPNDIDIGGEAVALSCEY